MEPRRFPGHTHWYHETLSTLDIHAAPLFPEAADVDDRFLLGLAAEGHGDLQSVLHQSGPALLASRRLYHLLFPERLTTSPAQTLTLYDRLSSALIVAQVTGIQRLCNHYAARLNPLTGPDSSRESNRRLTLITEFSRQLASQPGVIDSAALLRLHEAGLTTADIITFSQIIGFVSYQARVVAGIHALLALPARWIPGMTMPQDADPPRPHGRWHSDLTPVEQRHACPHQLEILARCQKESFFRENSGLLAHDAPVLECLNLLFCSLEEQRQTPEGALACAVSARINGSAACFYRYAEGKLRDALQQNVEQAALVATVKEKAVIGLAAQLTRSPERFTAAHIQPLKEQGMDLQSLFGLMQFTALASWHNRLMLALGSTEASGAKTA
ncbi:CMD domain-containing protein [Pantoea sp. FN060301]|uniref:CMD domain-containing protein n=1 Tax=Pantoea sp. FN060301 TaxID=3420380 RepID=UPI003D16750C